MDNQSIPSFFIIGVQKSATSSVHEILSQDSRISLPYRKETHFFSTNFNKDINWYLSMFKSQKYKIRGEIDPSYIHYEKTLKNIKKFNKFPKFIIIFRKPLDRAYSHYLMSKKRNYETLSFNDALESEYKRLNNDKNNFSFSHHSYMLRGNYKKQTERYMNQFPKSNYLFLKFDDYINVDNREIFIKKIYKFLNIEYKYNLKFDVHENVASTFKFRLIRNLIYNDNILKKIVKIIIPSKFIKYKIIRLIEKVSSEEKLDNDKEFYLSSLDRRFIHWNNNEAQKLTELTGLNTNDWIIQ